jgi:NAD(P)-dependent dehydrogenase (short-subunit alcohol dehydrogenase family)
MAEKSDTTPVALVTGASMGLGLALTRRLVQDGWRVIADARNPDRLHARLHPLGDAVTEVPGDVGDPEHRARLAAAVRSAGRLDLYVANASTLGTTPLPSLAAYPLADLSAVLAVNVIAPLALLQQVFAELRAGRGVVVTISSDAAIEAYRGWGGYGMSKAALDQMSAVLAVEEPDLAVYAVDPGDMATAMHAAADPDADPAGLADPADVAAALLALVGARPPSGRYRLADVTPTIPEHGVTTADA